MTGSGGPAFVTWLGKLLGLSERLQELVSVKLRKSGLPDVAGAKSTPCAPVVGISAVDLRKMERTMPPCVGLLGVSVAASVTFWCV